MKLYATLLVAALTATALVAPVSAGPTKGQGSKPTPIQLAKLNGSCTYVGCNERFTNDMGTTITTEGCNGNVKVKQTWTKQSDGSYTVTSRSEELSTECGPM